MRASPINSLLTWNNTLVPRAVEHVSERLVVPAGSLVSLTLLPPSQPPTVIHPPSLTHHRILQALVTLQLQVTLQLRVTLQSRLQVAQFTRHVIMRTSPNEAARLVFRQGRGALKM